MDLSVQCMGLTMPNPIIVSSSPLTATLKAVCRSVEAGAGAVVLKSLFEEDIASSVEKKNENYSFAQPEEALYAEQMSMILEPDAYLSFVEDCVAAVDVPVIASLNCYSSRWWVDYAERIAAVGAAGIELNLSPMALSAKTQASDIENKIIKMVILARKTVNIPLAVKLGPNFTSLPHLIHRLARADANALTLFNRYYKVDIDIESISMKSGNSLSAPEEFGTVLRWVGILSGCSDLDILASTGIYRAEDLVKILLAGAKGAQVCSTVLKNGLGTIKEMLDGLKSWMADHNYKSIADFRAALSLKDTQRDEFYQRLQYVKSLKS